MGEITLLTGAIQSGKTSLCLELIEHAKQEGILLGGLISPGVFERGEKIAIDLLDLRSGERKRLADEAGREDSEISTQRWSFRLDVVAWGNQILKESTPCDLLVIDELGPLEFQRGEGWVSAFDVITAEEYRSALVVVRPSLLEEALNHWNVERIIKVDDPDQELRDGITLYHALLGTRD